MMRIRKVYGIEEKKYETMLAEQGGACAVCLRLFTDAREPCVDHDHKSGRIRGLLCRKCNSLLYAVEYPGILGALLGYLKCASS